MTRPTTVLHTIPEVADRLRVKERTVYRLISSSALRAVNIAVTGKSRMRVRDDDLAAFIEARTVLSDAPSVEDALSAS